MKVIVILGLGILLFSSCQEEPENQCTDDFLTDYRAMEQSFVASYRPLAGAGEKNNLMNSLRNFLARHRDVTCESQEENYSPTAEVSALLSQLEASKSTDLAIPFTNKVIYGEDNRRDVAEVNDERFKSWARSTLAQMAPSKWDSDFVLDSETLGESYSLCSSERFKEQINPARCSGFLVAPNVVVTAGHCMQSQSDCANFSWVSDFVKGVKVLKEQQVFSCRRIIKQAVDFISGLDYAVIELDREITDRKYFSVQQARKIRQGTELVVIGHPSGLPTKVADGAIVRNNQEQHYFSANLDTYGGNSGSAVINKQTGQVEGILVRGDVDYLWTNEPVSGERCRVSNRCSDDGCGGEDVVRMSSVEGIPTVLQQDQLRDLLLGAQTAPMTEEGWLTSFAHYQFGSQALGAVKFLGQCGIHHYEQNEPRVWKDFFSGDCDQISQIDAITMSFLSQVYL